MKSLFPIFKNNPELVYLDSAASSQKPQIVIDWVADFLANDYANIHRWLYSLSERSENLYHQSKTMLSDLIHCKESEIIYSYNSTYCFNLLAQALVNADSKWEKKIWHGDKVLVGIREHHSNILPWQTLAQTFGFIVDFIGIDENYNIDRADFEAKYDESVKVVSVSHVSNVTGQIMDVKTLKSKLRDDTFFIIDWSQSVPHFPVNVQEIGCDALIMTAHKMFAHTWLGMLYLQQKRIKELNPMILWWGTPKDVSTTDFSLQWNSDKREAGTPNIVGAVSLLKALEFIQSIGMWAIREHEKRLTALLIEWFREHEDWIRVFGSLDRVEERVGVFSFEIKGKSFNKIGEFFANHNVCLRSGGHCAYPLHKSINANGSVRVSIYLYNDEQDIQSFFTVLDELWG